MSVVFESVHLQRFIKDNLNKNPKKQVANRGNGTGTYSLVIFVVSLGKDENRGLMTGDVFAYFYFKRIFIEIHRISRT